MNSNRHNWVVDIQPVTGSKKYYGVTSKKIRLGVMDQTLTITDFFAADYAITPITSIFLKWNNIITLPPIVFPDLGKVGVMGVRA